MPLTADKKVELQLEAWKKTIEVQEHFNDLALRIRNLFVTLLAATLAVVGYGIKTGQGQSAAPLSALILPYIPLVTGLGIAVCFAFWFLDRLWYHRLLRGAVDMGNTLEAVLAEELGDIGLTRSIGEASHMQAGPFTLDATLRLDFFYGLFAVVLAIVGENIATAPKSAFVLTYAIAAVLAFVAIRQAVIRTRKT
jgi:hypothetical protein